MNAEIGRELRAAATKRAESHPVDVERALLVGVRRYRWKVLAAYAAVTTLVILLAGAALLGHLAKAGSATDVKLTAITVRSSSTALHAGTQDQLSAQGDYSDGSTHSLTAMATWTSSNPSAVQVSAGGKALATGPGTAIITATFAAVKGGLTLTVTGAPPSATGLTATPATVYLQPGKTAVLTAQLTYGDGSTGPAKAVAWTSSDTLVATIDSAGIVTATGPGTATITAIQSGVEGTSTVTVAAAPAVSGLTVAPATVSLQREQSTTLTAQLTYSDGSTGPAGGAQWTSSNLQVAQVDGAGTVTATGPGTATITATQSGASGTSTVTVAAPSATGLTVAPATVSLRPGESTVLTAQVTYSDGSTGPAAGAQWTSSNLKVVQVDGAGTVTATGPGTATITATQSGASGTSTVTVAEPVIQ
ncbi:hypothetical protein B5P43_23480 [Bacillus sp. SRB_336]|nr:hypothetical protein B5P43_23480 [Bacillus sp. SRB_336]